MVQRAVTLTGVATYMLSRKAAALVDINDIAKSVRLIVINLTLFLCVHVLIMIKVRLQELFLVGRHQRFLYQMMQVVRYGES